MSCKALQEAFAYGSAQCGAVDWIFKLPFVLMPSFSIHDTIFHVFRTLLDGAVHAMCKHHPVSLTLIAGAGGSILTLNAGH